MRLKPIRPDVLLLRTFRWETIVLFKKKFRMARDAEVTVEANPDSAGEKLLRRLPKIVSIVPLGEKEPGVWEFSIEAEQGTDPRRALFERLAERKWPLMSLRSSELTLEEVFINMTNDAYRDATLVKKSKGGHS